jgi:dolichyl-phosphate mannosyltransferase polypeptide 2 regulatory subunit
MDASIGAVIIVLACSWHAYYSVWVLMTPWLETSPDLAAWLEYFPDRYYALAIPAILLIVVTTSTATFIGAVLSTAGLKRPRTASETPHGH